MIKISKIFNYIEEWIIALLLASMTLLTFSQVIARYIFNSGAIWALEVTTYLFAWLVLLGASYVIKCGSHIAINSLVNLFSEKNRKKITLFAISACMLFVIILFIGSYEYISLLKEIEVEMDDLPVFEWQAKIILPISFALMFYRLAEVMRDVIKGKTLLMHFADLHSDIPQKLDKQQ